jgi:hypothetical protein
VACVQLLNKLDDHLLHISTNEFQEKKHEVTLIFYSIYFPKECKACNWLKDWQQNTVLHFWMVYLFL